MDVVDQENTIEVQGARIKKPPPITPRRFTRFFTPRPRNASAAVKTSRAALKAISGSTVNSRTYKQREQTQAVSIQVENVTPRGRKRKLSFVLANDPINSSPASRVSFALSQEIRSSPIFPEQRSPRNDDPCDTNLCDTEDETEVESEHERTLIGPRIVPYKAKSTTGSLLSARLGGRKVRMEVPQSDLWQQETGNFFSSPEDVNNTFVQPSAVLPFSAAACNTNPLVAIGDEEGSVKLIDTSKDSASGMRTIHLTMRPHDNALMDLEFSPDDMLLATACGDQTCQVIDMQTQTSLYSLGDHRCSVKKIAFQPGSGNQILASCGRDGQINFWDLRCNNTPHVNPYRRPPTVLLSMTGKAKSVSSTHSIRDAHVAGPKSKASNTRRKANMVPGRTDFSVTSLSFLGGSKPHLLVTASEIDTTIKVWDIRTSFGTSRRAPNPLSVTDEPTSHAHHRAFGVTSISLNTDGSRLYALSRDHTVYVYATSHLVLGSSPQMSSKSKPTRTTEHNEGLGPLYGFRHPSLHVQTFWPRLSIRKATDSNTELLAVGSSDDCAVIFPTNERYLTKSTSKIQPLHNLQTNFSSQTSFTRSKLTRQSSSFTQSLISAKSFSAESTLPIYYHGTSLTRGHDKEVTSLAWTSEGNLVTSSDDYTVRCWRENAAEARRMRTIGEKNGARWRCGWSDVGVEGFDDEES